MTLQERIRSVDWFHRIEMTFSIWELILYIFIASLLTMVLVGKRQ